MGDDYADDHAGVLGAALAIGPAVLIVLLFLGR
jgi:hypothetical protein